jgi:hypothetical protein
MLRDTPPGLAPEPLPDELEEEATEAATPANAKGTNQAQVAVAAPAAAAPEAAAPDALAALDVVVVALSLTDVAALACASK